MESVTKTNFFELTFEPGLDVVYRGSRNVDEGGGECENPKLGQFQYALSRSAVTNQAVTPEPRIKLEFLRAALADAILRSRQFFDVQPHRLVGSIAGDLFYKEPVFSVAKAFELQPCFDEQRFYLTVDIAHRIYNRLRLPEVLGKLGESVVEFPLNGLVFTGAPGEERWQDCRILAVVENEQCVVRLAKNDELQVPRLRVIPKLPTLLMKRLLRAVNSNTQLETILKRESGSAVSGKPVTVAGRIQELVDEYVRPLFPLALGDARVHLANEPQTLGDLGARLIAADFELAANVDEDPQSFIHVREGLRDVARQQAILRPAVLFCTPDTKMRAEALIRTLNAPTGGIGGFGGMAKHFGVELMLIPGATYVAADVEQYIDLTTTFVQSPDQKKQEAIAFYVLDEADETYVHPVPLYYRLKAILAKSGRPSQFVDRDTLVNKYAHWNLALNTAAKLGAIPWTLQSGAPLAPVDLFLGLSYSSIRAERLGESRNIAYVNVFDQSGAWKMFCAEASTFSFEERLKVFPRLASTAIRTATEAPNRIRLAEVHFNKRFSKQERRALVEGIRRLAPKASVIFASISDDHAVRFIHAGVDEKGARRGSVVVQGPDRAFVQTVSESMGHEPPRPLRVQTFREFCEFPQSVEDVCSRVLALTRLNWRSVRDYAALPVTISYSSRVAKLTNYFNMADWTDIDHRLKRTPWFL